MPTVYSDEFKADAVALVQGGMTQMQVCRDLGVSKSALGLWVRNAGLASRGLPVSGDPTEAKQMGRALRRIRELEEENEILRRAAAYLSRANLKSPK